jgi:DNA-binding Xre family transcriptional regulator
MENKQEYVSRMLSSGVFNRAHIARSTGISNSTLSHIVRGKSKNLHFSTVEKLVEYFQLSNK